METFTNELPIGMTDDVCIFIKTLTGEMMCLTVDPYVLDKDLTRMIYESDPVTYPLETFTLTRVSSSPREWGLHDEEIFLLLAHQCRACDDFLQTEPQTHCLGGVTVLHGYDHTRDLIRYVCNAPEEVWHQLEESVVAACYTHHIEIPIGCAVHVRSRYGIFVSNEIGIHYLLRRESGHTWRRYLLVDSEIDKECTGSFESLMTVHGCFYCLDTRGVLHRPTYGIN